MNALTPGPWRIEEVKCGREIHYDVLGPVIDDGEWLVARVEVPHAHDAGATAALIAAAPDLLAAAEEHRAACCCCCDDTSGLATAIAKARGGGK